MPPIRIALCTYSYGIGNGIAHMDEALATGLDPERFSLTTYVLRPDLPERTVERHGETTHISLASAFAFLCAAFAEVDIVQVNGAFDPVACSAAATAGVKAIVEVMHQVETGGLHPSVDVVVCVSELVCSAQVRERTLVIPNGVDTDRFSFKAGRRHRSYIVAAQVSNAEKVLHMELGEVAAKLADPRLRVFTAGSRPPSPGVPHRGVITDMPGLYHSADLLFLIEKRSAFGLVFAEAMACGTLPLVSADSGAASFVEHGRTGWIVDPRVPGSAEETLKAALDAVGSPQFVVMQRRARAVVEQHFSLTRMIHTYQALYSALAARPRKASAPSPAWMELALYALLRRHGNSAALDALGRFIAEPRPLEEDFLIHPMGKAAITAALHSCPSLTEEGRADLVAGLSRRLRASHVLAPGLEAIGEG